MPIEPAEIAKKKKRDLKRIKLLSNPNDIELETREVKLNGDENKITKLNDNQETQKTKKSSLFKETMHSIFDFTLFYDVLFMFFAASNFLTSLGFNAPYIFIVDQAISLGIEKHKADFLVSAIGECFLTLFIYSFLATK